MTDAEDEAEWSVTACRGDGFVYAGPEGRVFFDAGPVYEPDGSRRVRYGKPVFGIGLTDLRDSGHSLGSPRRLPKREAETVVRRIKAWAATDMIAQPYDLHLEHGIEDEAGKVRPYPHVSKRDQKKLGNRIARKRT